jgi:enoyl-CoA hydratase
VSATFQWECEAGIGTLSLLPAAAGKPPTLDHAALDRLDAALAQVEAQAGALRVLFLRSASPKYFCVGADLVALRQVSTDTIAAWIEHGHRVFNRLEDLPLPVVARVEGYALGGGLELALACDLIFAGESAQIGQTEARLGFVAGWGGSWRLPRRIGPARAKELFFTARIISAAAAERLGLVDFVGPGATLEAHCRAFAADVVAGSAVSAREHKALVAGAGGRPRSEACSAETRASLDCLRAPDTQARLAAFFARKP